VILATKFGNVRDEQGKYLGVNGHPEYVRKCWRPACCGLASRTLISTTSTG
jgi:hypothetical protein